MKKINAFVVATLILLFLATSAPAPTRTYRAGILTVNRWLQIYASGYFVNSGYYEQVYEGNVADAFKVDYRGTGYKLFHLLADGVTVLELTKTGALGLTGYMDIDQGTFPTGLVFSGTVDQDNQKAMSFTSSADTDFDNTWGIRGTVNTGTGTLSDQGGILLRESIGAQFDLTVAVDESTTDYDYAQAVGVLNQISITGKQGVGLGVYNKIVDVSGRSYNQATGVYTEGWTGLTVWDDTSVYGVRNFFRPDTVNNNGAIVGDSHQIYLGGTADGATSYGVGVSVDLLGTLYDGTGTGDANVKGTSTMFRSEAGDVGYDFYSGTDLYSVSTGGTRYGYYADMTDTDVTRWSVYVTQASGNSYFGTDTDFVKDAANATVNISSYHDDETTTPTVTLRKADNTEASPQPVDQGAVLGTINFDGRDDNSFDNGARIYAKADANWGAAERGTDIFVSTRDGAGTLTDQFTFTAGGDFEGVTSKWWFCHYIDMIEVSPGGSGATWTAPDANTIGGYQLDLETEYLYFSVRVCPNWDAASDLRLGITFEVNVDNTGGLVTDTVDLQLLCYYKGQGDTSSKTQTLEEATVVGQSPQYKTFQTLFTIDYNPGGGNDVEIYDVISFRLNLETDTSEVDNIIANFGAFAFKTAEGFIQISEAP